MTAPRPVEDRDSAPWWAAVREHRLTVQRCDGCGALRFPAVPICARCRSRGSGWREVSGRGTIASWIVTHHAFLPAYTDAVPYVVALVRLAEQDDLVMYGDLRGIKPDEVEPGLAVRADFDDLEPGLTIVRWRPLA
jgi:uncharacterized OB-fold protein